MKRWTVLALMACFIMSVGLIAAMFLSSKSLASSTIDLGGTPVRFDVTERDGQIYVSACERRVGSNGWQSIHLVGNADDLGSGLAKIIAQDDLQVRLQFDKRTVVFDGKTRSFLTP